MKAKIQIGGKSYKGTIKIHIGGGYPAHYWTLRFHDGDSRIWPPKKHETESACLADAKAHGITIEKCDVDGCLREVTYNDSLGQKACAQHDPIKAHGIIVEGE